MAMASGTVEELRGISSMAVRQMLEELRDDYAQRSGQRVDVVSVGGVDAARRVRDGEAFDFVVLAADVIARLAAEGHVDASSRVDLARSGMAIAVTAGVPSPDVGNESAVRDAVLRARSIAYSTGPSGAHLLALLERWGIGVTVASRLVQAPPGTPVGTLLARGDAELGFQQSSELQHVPGIAVVGPFPPDIQLITVFSAAICRVSKRRAATERLLSFLGSGDADAAKRRHGMEPATAGGS
jgi:molybdate transport system substrate-binding protein